MLAILIVIASLSSILQKLNYDVIDYTRGYGIIWLVTLYIIGAYIRLYVKKEHPKYLYLLLYIMFSLLIYVSRLIIGIFNENSRLMTLYYEYNFITVALSSVCLFMFFKAIKIQSLKLKSAILHIAPFTFAIYLIHEHPLIRNILYSKILHTEKFLNSPFFVLAMLLSCMGIYSI